ncbi:MAG: tyrosine phenol-lyase [Planctomycetota bacterium]|nr:MAG: tyrosine phenol-lyase [Planctomycetota bacterium]
MPTIIEPFRIHSVQPLRMTTRDERQLLIDAAHHNLFGLRARDVLIDLLTDSGTGAMSCEQWAAVMRGDESYAGSDSYARFEHAVRDITGMPHVIPTHQGRAAEHILFSTLVSPGDVVPNNTHFDTTRANIEASGGLALDLPCDEAGELHVSHKFKGDMDLDALTKVLDDAPGPGQPGHVPLVLVTITNNAGGGQPVSLGNLTRVRDICRAHGVPLFLDACRFAENAWLIRCREPGQDSRSVRDIVADTFDLADGCTMSAKKEGLGNIGGFLSCRDAELARVLRQRLVVTEGFPTYGGMAGRDLDAVAQGLHEVLDEDYQEYRHASIKYVCEHMHERGVPVVRPAGGHAIFLDASRFLPHLPWQAFPGQALALELYLEGGVRSCEIGSLMLGRKHPETGEELPARAELVRLAVPRRTYTQSHMDYVVDVTEDVWKRRNEIAGVALVNSPDVLRHFTAKMRRIPVTSGAGVG